MDPYFACGPVEITDYNVVITSANDSLRVANDMVLGDMLRC